MLYNPNSALDYCGIDLRLVIIGLQKPLKRYVHRDVPLISILRFWITSIYAFGMNLPDKNSFAVDDSGSSSFNIQLGANIRYA